MKICSFFSFKFQQRKSVYIRDLFSFEDKINYFLGKRNVKVMR